MMKALLFLSLLFVSQDWPEFRGPTGQGHSDERGLPLTWSETRNVRWKTAIPGRGWSSPSPSRNRSLPAHVPGLAPRQRESAFIRMTLPCRASEFGPILGYKKEGKKKEGFHHD